MHLGWVPEQGGPNAGWSRNGARLSRSGAGGYAALPLPHRGHRADPGGPPTPAHPLDATRLADPDRLGWGSRHPRPGGRGVPRVLFEPPTAFEAGKLTDYLPGTVSERFRAAQRVWIVRTDRRIVAVLARCTHLGCTPSWQAAENKFKCPCHGSGFKGFGPEGAAGDVGVHFEGPAPRPLERVKVTVDADGTLLVDKSVRFLWEREEWDKPGAFVEV